MGETKMPANDRNSMRLLVKNGKHAANVDSNPIMIVLCQARIEGAIF